MTFKTLSNNWQILLCLFALFFSVGTIQGAAESLPTKFIIAADTDPSYGLESFVKKYGNTLSATLGLGSNSTIKVLAPSENIFEQIPPDPIVQPCVIIAQGKRTEAVINAFEKTSRPPKTVHSMILFDPIIRRVTNIDYDRVINRIYNFYSEVTASQYRKINSHYDSAKNQLQGLNIKCEYINKLGARLPANFTDLFVPGDKREQQLAYLSATIVVIKELKTYKVENDFHCVLFSMNDTVLSDKLCPIINTNKRTYIDKNNILQTHIMSGVKGDYNSPASDQLSPELFKKIEKQRTVEREKSRSIEERFADFTRFC